MIDLAYYFDPTSIAAFVFANVYIEMCFVTFNIFFPYISFRITLYEVITKKLQSSIFKSQLRGKMKKYKAVLYDLDCTLLDTMKMNLVPLQRIIKEEKNEDWSIHDLRPFMAYTGLKVLDLLHIENKEQTYERWVKYVNEFEEGAKAFPHVEEVLKKLHKNNIRQGVVSSKFKNQYQIDFVSKGLDRYMDLAILGDDTKLHKPNPEPIELAIQKMNLNKDEVIYIGDAYSDYQACVNAGIDFGYAAWGSFSDKGIHPTIRLNSVLDILKLVNL